MFICLLNDKKSFKLCLLNETKISLSKPLNLFLLLKLIFNIYGDEKLFEWVERLKQLKVNWSQIQNQSKIYEKGWKCKLKWLISDHSNYHLQFALSWPQSYLEPAILSSLLWSSTEGTIWETSLCYVIVALPVWRFSPISYTVIKFRFQKRFSNNRS